MIYNTGLINRKEHKMKRDPVCGMQVDSKNPGAKYVYKGKEYYFCSEGCKKKFMESPESYTQTKNNEQH